MKIQNMRRWFAHLGLGALVVLLSACPAKEDAAGNKDTELTTSAAKPSTEQAWRFLSHATFGPSDADIASVKTLGLKAWIDEQFAMRPQVSYESFYKARAAELKKQDGSAPQIGQIVENFYTNALTDPAQLRHRVTFALSEIFVTSTVIVPPDYMAGYLDMLDSSLDGNYRGLLESVSKSPAMGIYLTFRSNQKEGAARVPDQNYAREIMQLFSIGLYNLKTDGTQVLNGGKPTETYNSDDIKALSKVFTGWSNARGGNAGVDTECFLVHGSTCKNPEAPYQAMESYPDFHSTSKKEAFPKKDENGNIILDKDQNPIFNLNIPAQSTPDPEASLKMTLDYLAGHQNTAPFFCKQLIQRLVSSNPSPAYVGRVVAEFLSSNGNLKATVKAILTDVEATDELSLADPTKGKVREPILRLTAILRAFKFGGTNLVATSSNIKNAGINDTSDVSTSFGQSPFAAPSVFNYFRPGYVPPQSETASHGMVAPELQITDETSVTGYVNAVQSLLNDGFVTHQKKKVLYMDLLTQRSLAASPEKLMTDITNRLLGGQISEELKTKVTEVLSDMTVPALSGSNQAAVNAALDLRVNAAILMTAVSPEFLIIK